jgi:hypothetical protein
MGQQTTLRQQTLMRQQTADIDVTSYILAHAETRTPAATPVQASVNRTASTSFAAAVPRLQSPVGPPNMTINVRIPERSPGRISGGPARRSEGVAIAVDVQFNERGAESPH